MLKNHMSTCKKTHVNMQHLFLMAREHRRVLAQLTFEARQEDAALAQRAPIVACAMGTRHLRWVWADS